MKCILKLVSFASLLFIFVIQGCSPRKSKEQLILGRWIETKVEDEFSGPEISNAERFSDADFEFTQDSVRFIFPEDMAEINETCSWKIIDDTLYIHWDLRYKIEKLTSNEMVLVDYRNQPTYGKLKSYYIKKK